jgi:adenosine deaminase
VDSALETLEQSLPYRDWIVGVGLDSDERGNPPAKFKEVFARARREGYRLTMHCDVDQHNSVEHIWQCLDEIKVERIDHGVNALEDTSLVKEINRRGLGLTVCPISNRYVTNGLKEAELKAMLAQGVKATINSDDPAYFPGYMNENLLAVERAASLTRADIVQVMRNAFDISWIEADERARFLDALEAYSAR